jgi:hypothetical protein
LGEAADQRRQLLILKQRRERVQELPAGPTRDSILKGLDEQILALQQGYEAGKPTSR